MRSDQRGLVLDFKEKIRSINFASQRRRDPKKTVDVHDHHTVEVTEHWNERVDVNVKVGGNVAVNPHIKPKEGER